jgi:hypothetical protein
MKCYYHPEIEAIATCVVCGKGICKICSVDVAGRITCQRCLALGNITPLQTQSSNPTNTLAIISLILGVLGLCGGVFFSIPAWIIGHIAQKQILETPHQEGVQLASAGKILGMVMTIIYGALISCYLIFLIGTFLLALIQPKTY